jgi:hypothetical protein
MKYINLTKYIGVAFIFSLAFTSCEDSIDEENNPVPYSSIGGYTNSDEIASESLVTKLSFEDNLNDIKANITGAMPVKVAYTTGIKGKAYQGSDSENRYAVANATGTITGLNAFTISFWMNSNGTVDPATPGQGKGAQGIFSIVRPTEFWGGINVFLENPDSANPDRIRLKLGVENGRAGVVWGGQGAIVNIDSKKNTWLHVVLSYDPKVSKMYAYINGEPAGNIGSFPYAPAAGVNTGYASWFASDPGSINNTNGVPGYGDFKMVGTNGKVVFGSHQFETDPPLNNGSQQDWATSYVGLLDEFRIYNASLSSADIVALYKLEKDGR